MLEHRDGFATTPAAVLGRGFRKVPADIFERFLSAAELGALVLLHLLANFRSGRLRGSSATLRDDCPLYSVGKELCPRWARKILERLETEGLVERVPRDKRHGRWTGYAIAPVGVIVSAGPNKGKLLMPDGSYADAENVRYVALPLRVLDKTRSRRLGLVEVGVCAMLWHAANPATGKVAFCADDMLERLGTTTQRQLLAALKKLEAERMILSLDSGSTRRVLLHGYWCRVGPNKGKYLDAFGSPCWEAPVYREPERRPKKDALTAHNAADAAEKPNGKANVEADVVQHAQQNGNGADDFPYSMPFDQRCLYEWERGLRNYDGHESKAERDDAWAFAERLREWVLREAKPSWRDRQLWEAAERLRPNLLKGWEARKAGVRANGNGNGNGRTATEPATARQKATEAAKYAEQADNVSDEAAAQFVTEYHNARWPGAAFGASDIMRFFLCKRHGLKAEAFNMPVPQQIRELARKIDSRISFAARWNADAFWAEALKNRAALQSPGTARTEGLEHVGSIAERMLQ